MPEEMTKDNFLTEIQGDLFTCGPEFSLVHSVSTDLRMGRGIAVEFKKRFGGLLELRDQDGCVGDALVLSRQGRFVYYLITKDVCYYTPRYHDLKATLVSCREHAVQHNVCKLAMPRISCCMDRLNWVHVREMICDVFRKSGIQICVYYL